MTSLEIRGIPASTYTRAVRMVCEEKGVPYDFSIAGPHSPEITEIHPFGKVPVMLHGDLKLCESSAIASYIDRVFDGPQMFPADPREAATVTQWVSMINTIMDRPMVRGYVLEYIFAENGKPDREAIDAAVETIKEQIPVLDAAVAKSGHLAGNGFTYADINLMVILFYLRQFPEGAELLRGSANLEAYYARHSQRPSFTATSPQIAG